METPTKVESMPLSELETSLLTRFQSLKELEPSQLNDKERGALGKLSARKLIEKVSVPIEGSKKMRRLWRIVEAKEAIPQVL